MERLKKHFAKQGLDVADVPKAIVIHEVIGLSMAIGFWTVCYTFRPTKTLFKPVSARLSRNQAAQQAYNTALVQAERTVQKFGWLKKTPLGKDAGRLTVSLAESLCIRAAIKPATFPFKIWAAYVVFLAFKPKRSAQHQLAPPAGWLCRPLAT